MFNEIKKMIVSNNRANVVIQRFYKIKFIDNNNQNRFMYFSYTNGHFSSYSVVTGWSSITEKKDTIENKFNKFIEFVNDFKRNNKIIKDYL